MNVFAASGSCFDPEMYIKGQKKGSTFVSKEFTGIMDSQKFWDDLANFAKQKRCYIYLVY